MKAGSKDRKVLLIEDEPVAREVLRALVNNLGCHGEVVADGRQALAMVRYEDFDAVLLDLRSSAMPFDEVVSGIHDIRPSLVGRVLVITGEADDKTTLDLVERFFLLQVRRSRLKLDLAGRLRALLQIAPLSQEFQP
ncbi:MAG: response regulator [Acidobacteria bacterium]|nr:MAG: response regulator [Acidobacteriota bacterium]